LLLRQTVTPRALSGSHRPGVISLAIILNMIATKTGSRASHGRNSAEWTGHLA
jgi:hypothetical protein